MTEVHRLVIQVEGEDAYQLARDIERYVDEKKCDYDDVEVTELENEEITNEFTLRL